MAKTTIDDVAALAGVSIKTVSRVVNQEANVRPATRDKVQAAITRLNYQPNQSARSLAGRRSFLLGMLYDNPSASYVIDVQNGILAACRAGGYDLVIHPCDHRSRDLKDELLTLLRDSRVDGLVLTPPLSDLPAVTRTLNRQKTPYVRIAPATHDRGSPYVYCNDRHGAYQMAQHLIELGHRRIGFVAGHPDHGASGERQLGFTAALKDHGLAFHKRLAVQGYFDFDSGVAAGRKLLARRERPTAIFCCNDEMACGVMHVAHDMGLRIPAQLSVTGFDDSPIARHIWPSLTTVRQPVRDMARQASQLLLAQLRAQPLPDTRENVLDCRLVPRQSTAAPANS